MGVAADVSRRLEFGHFLMCFVEVSRTHGPSVLDKGCVEDRDRGFAGIEPAII